MFKSLYAKLALALLGLVLFLATSVAIIATQSAPVFLQELNQRLHRDLAVNLVKETKLFSNATVNQNDWNKVFMGLMLVNPSIEVYLLNLEGKILAYSAPPGRVKIDFINLEPINNYLDAQKLPILGDDPRGDDRKKVFSAAPIYDNNALHGYLYIVLGGEAYDSVVEMLESSYVSRFAIAGVFVALILSFIGGLIIFNIITRRVRALSQSMEKFKRSDFQQLPVTSDKTRSSNKDEIGQLHQTFDEMALRMIQQLKDLHHIDASRRELVASVSHDLRTPLASLQGYLETLCLKGETLSDEEKQKYLDIAFRQSQRLGRLVSELFELALLDSKGTSLHFEPFSLSELLQDVTQKFNLQAEQKHLSLSTKVTQETHFVTADIALIERVLENLIENAIKYTPEGGKIEMDLIPGDQIITLNVRDNGPGIPQEALPRLFDRFYRVEKHRDTGIYGTGLGLAIAQRILQLHNSQIQVESESNIGTNFHFDLPLYS